MAEYCISDRRLTVNRWVDMFLSLFAPAEVSQLPRELIEPAAGWAGHVERLKSELRVTVATHPQSWGFHDYIATLLIRDRVERLLPSVPEALRNRVTAFIQRYDDELTSFTEDDRDELLIRFASSGGGLTEKEFMASQWWWRRIPQSGPVVEELLGWHRRMSEHRGLFKPYVSDKKSVPVDIGACG
jgi:hypothetical protein